jgi:hypothetical protein
MKSLKLIFTILTFSLVTLSMYSCGNGKNAKANTEQSTDTSKQGKEYTSAYICPMHCEGSGSDKPGDCPVCGMAYKKNDKNNKEDHSGHNH